jgi:ADP-ribose pyrophosphatase
MEKQGSSENEELLYSGKFFEVLQKAVTFGDKTKKFENARRPPGTRLLIIKDGKILITREYRYELGGYDYRLPGGKVFDTLEEFRRARESGEEILKSAENAAMEECRQEAGLTPKRLKHYLTTKAGATVVWDLYYFIIDGFVENESGQELEAGEVIETSWRTFEQAKEMCLNGQIKEDRSVGVLLKFLLKKEKK